VALAHARVHHPAVGLVHQEPHRPGADDSPTAAALAQVKDSSLDRSLDRSTEPKAHDQQEGRTDPNSVDGSGGQSNDVSNDANHTGTDG
jgi:hypothetical protein